jgi:uncharacterized protein with von Willebrand factor type A (vWA) domain
MSEIQVIESALQRAAARRRWARALRGLWVGLLIGAILSLLLVAAWHLFPLPLWTLALAALVPFPCIGLGLIIGGWRRVALPEVARWVDGKQHLQERLSTALEVSSTEASGRWRDLVVTDAAQHLRELDVRKLVPLRVTRSARWALVVLALAAGLGFVPEYRSKAYVQKQADQRNIKEVGRQLADLTRHSVEKRAPALQPTEKALEAVAELGDQLAKKNLTRSEALKDLANLAEKLKDEIKEMGKDPALKRMEQAARAASGNDPQTAAGLQKQIESLQKQLGSPTGNPEALDKVKKDLEKLQAAAKAMADKNSPGSDAERQKLSEALSALSKQMQDMGAQLPQLDDAIKALAENNPGMVLKDLDASMLDLEKMRDMAKKLQQLQQQQSEKMGKDLAEQLKNGQPEAAQGTLQKMAQQLQQSSLSEEQMRKMMDEVSKAIDPAGNYGKVADHLKDASKDMKAGDKKSAGQALAAAAKELGELMQQMGDAQALMASLDSVNQASMCVGSGQGWGKCAQPGYKPSSNGKPGSGYGDWSDSTAEWDGQMNDHWDNSGSPRPDKAPRGMTDRGDGAPTDALTPTKVKGQFSPGGSMPSITLKGVSIKGQSKVSYEEASAAAQSEAQSALSQEKVPRAYQGAVRDYFDDLKK